MNFNLCVSVLALLCESGYGKFYKQLSDILELCCLIYFCLILISYLGKIKSNILSVERSLLKQVFPAKRER